MAPPAPGSAGGYSDDAEERLQNDSDLKEDGTLKGKKKKTPRVGVRQAKASPVQARPALSEKYEGPMSGRENWWRSTIKVTPIPGAYDIPADFIDELVKRPNTYRFRSDGRKVDPTPQIGHGQYLLPGAYMHKDLAEDLKKVNSTYSFKDTGRDQRDFLNFGKKDKDINVPPNEYNTEKYLTLSCDKHSSKNWQFRSQSNRFPTIHFVPKEGPAPGNYEYQPDREKHAVSSSFKSKTPRFVTSHTKTPGPGTYEKTFQAPMPKTIMKMGRQHGLFFSSAFQV